MSEREIKLLKEALRLEKQEVVALSDSLRELAYVESEVRVLKALNETKQKVIESYERQVEGLLQTIKQQNNYIDTLREALLIKFKPHTDDQNRWGR